MSKFVLSYKCDTTMLIVLKHEIYFLEHPTYFLYQLYLINWKASYNKKLL